MIDVARTDTSVLGRWWWTVDRWSLTALGLLSALGVILILAGSPASAGRIGLGHFHFVERHLLVLLPALLILFATSLLSPTNVLRLSAAVLAAALLGVVATLFVGVEIKGATRWLHLPGLSIQPSEFVKPAFAVLAAWLFARQKTETDFPGTPASIACCLAIVLLLLLQPDVGMAAVVVGVWGAQFFLAGLPLVFVAGIFIVGAGALVGAYYSLDHVASRIDRFLDPAAGDNYQVQRSLDAFMAGGPWGTGPGEGTVKYELPDAHADFIFAVAGEEFGLIGCVVLVVLFGFVVLRGFYRLTQGGSLFALLAGAGLLLQFGMQALINMASAVNLIPTKGMTLPFISYGGSSLLALAYGMGMMLALTRRRPGPGGVW